MRYQRIVMMTLLLFVMFLTHVYAEEKGSIQGKLTLTAEVPKDFQPMILINFVLKNKSGVNYLLPLEEKNKYRKEKELIEGIYEVDFIDVMGKSLDEYQLTYPKTITIKKNQPSVFTLKVATADIKEATPNDRSINAEKLDAANHVEQVQTSVTNGTPDPHEQTADDENHQSIIILLLIGIPLGILLFFWGKFVAYKHDYYDIGGGH